MEWVFCRAQSNILLLFCLFILFHLSISWRQLYCSRNTCPYFILARSWLKSIITNVFSNYPLLSYYPLIVSVTLNNFEVGTLSINISDFSPFNMYYPSIYISKTITLELYIHIFFLGLIEFQWVQGDIMAYQCLMQLLRSVLNITLCSTHTCRSNIHNKPPYC